VSSTAKPGVGTRRLTPRARWAIGQASDAFDRALGEECYLRCPEHGVDHTGKTARAIVINCALAAHDGDERFIDRAVRVARAVTGRLGQDDAAGNAWVFFPGRHHPKNISTNVIDCGECVDALATLLHAAGDHLSHIDRARLEEAIRLCADTYLAPTAPGKPVINQRLWGAMGLAKASAVLDEPSWAQAARTAVERALAEMRSDGSFPYVADATAIGEHDGISDLTVYYHSRVIAFARYALDLIGDDSHADELRRAVDFLVDVLRPDGVKPLALEGKRWFWDSDFEVGSAAYDAYALATDGRAATRRLAGIVAARSARAVGPDGFVDASPTGPAFVCRVFHTADLAWLARAHMAAELEDLPTNPLLLEPNAPVHHAEAGVVRIQSRKACAMLRTAKRPANGLVGGRVGGGGLVYTGRSENGWVNVLSSVCEPWMPEGTWSLAPTSRQLPTKFDKATRFRLHIARMHWRAGRRRYALRMLYRLFGPPAWAAANRYASSHALDGNVTMQDDAVLITSWLARQDGEVHPDVETERRYEIRADRLSVADTVLVRQPIAGLAYHFPQASRTLTVDAPTSWHMADHHICFGPLGVRTRASIRYEI